MTPVLPDALHERIVTACKDGDALAAAGKLEAAKGSYLAALKLLPGEHRQWEAATWIYVALGDTHLQLHDHDKAFKCFVNAVQCPHGVGNPYIHLRLGQLCFERGELEQAADELTRAYMGGGVDIFMEDDPKYLAFLETRIVL